MLWTWEVPKLTQTWPKVPKRPRSKHGWTLITTNRAFMLTYKCKLENHIETPNPIIQFTSSNPGMKRCSRHTCLGVINSGGLRPLEDQTSPHSINSIDILINTVGSRWWTKRRKNTHCLFVRLFPFLQTWIHTRKDDNIRIKQYIFIAYEKPPTVCIRPKPK